MADYGSDASVGPIDGRMMRRDTISWQRSPASDTGHKFNDSKI